MKFRIYIALDKNWQWITMDKIKLKEGRDAMFFLYMPMVESAPPPSIKVCLDIDVTNTVACEYLNAINVPNGREAFVTYDEGWFNEMYLSVYFTVNGGHFRHFAYGQVDNLSELPETWNIPVNTENMFYILTWVDQKWAFLAVVPANE